MDALVPINQASELECFQADAAITLVSPAELTGHKPDAHWMLVNAERSVLARCSLWWQDTSEYQQKRVGFIGHYAASNADAARELLEHACRELARQGCQLAIGPLDGTTWRRYRLIVERGDQPLFFLEPDNPDQWPDHFTNSGFSELASYTSSLNTDLSYTDPRLDAVAERMEQQGVLIRQLDISCFDRELESIFELSLLGFRNNLLYSPISREEFCAMYQKVKPFIRPELTLLAEHEGRCCGFMFAVPDMLQAQRGEELDQVILKSVAVLPGKSYGGLGNLLMARVLANARKLGFRRAIHALMLDSNSSLTMSNRYATPMRRYALFARGLP